MTSIIRAGALLLTWLILAALLAPTAALAHPLGNFTTNHYSRIEPAADGVRVVYVLDQAEIPTFQERPSIDADRDGQLSESEREQYADRRAEALRRNLDLRLDGVPAELRLVSRSLSFPPGQGGLETLRLEAVYSAPLPSQARGPVDLAYRDGNDLARIGWREIVARPGAAGTEIRQASVPEVDRSDELRAYPDDLLNSPLDVRDARLTVVLGAAAAAAPSALAQRPIVRPTDVYAELAAADDLSMAVIFLSLATAMALGALHALSPGHGKTVVAAYLVGSRGTAGHALFLGATVTATHTAGVYALGFVTLYLSEYILPEQLYPILQTTSGLLVIGIGAWLFVSRARWALAYRRTGASTRHADHGGTAVAVAPLAGPHHATDAPSRAEAHDHAHDHDHGYDHDHDHGHAHDLLGGHGHPHGDNHEHGHHGPHAHDHPHGHEHADVAAPAVHSHGGRPHSHLPPGADGRPVTWRSLLALGVSGGLLPCPSALVVLLSAIALHRVAFGLLLIVAFSLGLAAVLVGIGLILVYARSFFAHLSFGGGLAARLVPAGSALVIVVLGVVMTFGALPQAF